MGIAQALTNDIERSVKMKRVPILTALALSLRDMVEQSFLVTDPRTEDDVRNVVSLKRISTIEQRSCDPGVGVDDRQFSSLTGILLFDGLPDENGVIQPIDSMTNMAGRGDDLDVRFTATGTTDQKEEKIKRYGVKRPGDVTWRVRTPVMMAGVTSVIDYMAFRCTRMKYLHSISLKWSDRRWDGRQVPLDRDNYRPAGEKTDMIIIPAMWMDPTMTTVDPNIWQPYQPIIAANYNEYVARQKDELKYDGLAFVTTYQDYMVILKDGVSPIDAIGRVYRGLDTQLNRSLRIAFDKNIKSVGSDVDTYEVTCFDPHTQGTDDTQAHFNTQELNGVWRLTSSFECTDGATDADKLQNDGWFFSPLATYSLSSDIPSFLPPFAYDSNGNPVYGSKSLSLSGFAVRRMVLKDGTYALKFWVKGLTGSQRVEVVRNTRQKPKGQWMTGNRVTNVEHFREAYETVAASQIRSNGGWTEVWINFSLVDHYQVSEPYPQHELYIVIQADDGSLFDQFNLLEIAAPHKVSILNTINRSDISDITIPELKHVDLEKAFNNTPTPSQIQIESPASAFRFDGKNIACELVSQTAYNAHETGTTINSWFRVNSEDEAGNRVLYRLGGFTLFQKNGVHIPGYSCSLNNKKNLIFTLNNSQVFSSSSILNHFLHPAVCNSCTLPRIDWSNPTQYENYQQAYHLTGLQPSESYKIENTGSGPIALRVTTDITHRLYDDIGYGKQIIVARTGSLTVDPYDFAGDFLWLNGGTCQTPNGQTYSVLPGQMVLFSRYMQFHENAAYAPVVPHQDLSPGSGSGFYFSPAPMNGFLDPDSATIDMLKRYPLFLTGILQFDRWFNFDVSMAGSTAVISINGVMVGKNTSITFPGGENGDRLIIGTANSDATGMGAPISVYSFKIFQRQNTQADCIALVGGEATNFNLAQYQIFGELLDFDGDGVLDFWQEDMTDLGLWTIWTPGSYPIRSPAIAQGWVRADGPDPTAIRVDYDRNRNLIADWYDDQYLQELIDAQTIGFQDGLIFWDFATPEQDGVHGYKDRYWDPVCRKYVNRTLSYYDWLSGVITNEVNSVIAITDDIPNTVTAGSPIPDPSPFPPPKPPNSPYASFGSQDGQLLMTGVKGWFGYSGLLGYRDSIDKVRLNGVIFNYLQIELHFRAPRAELEALLAPYAKSIDQLFTNDIIGGR